MKCPLNPNISPLEVEIEGKKATTYLYLIASRVPKSAAVAVANNHALRSKPLDFKEIWHPEWEHFKIMKVNQVYTLLEKNKIVFHSSCYDAVKMELIERFHFYEQAKKQVQSKPFIPDD